MLTIPASLAPDLMDIKQYAADGAQSR